MCRISRPPFQFMGLFKRAAHGAAHSARGLQQKPGAPEKIMAKTVEVGVLSGEEWKMIVGAEGPCISILEPVPILTTKTHRPARLKRAIESVERQLSDRLVDPSQQSQLLEPLYEFEASKYLDGEERGNGLVIFRSLRTFQHFYVS